MKKLQMKSRKSKAFKKEMYKIENREKRDAYFLFSMRRGAYGSFPAEAGCAPRGE